MTAEIRVRRVYDEPGPGDGVRVLVDRVWPRGLRKADAKLDEWAKDLAPSTDLRVWYGHDPAKFSEFRRRYIAELDAPGPRERLAEVRALSAGQPVTLLTATRDVDISQAAVLAELLRAGEDAGRSLEWEGAVEGAFVVVPGRPDQLVKRASHGRAISGREPPHDPGHFLPAPCADPGDYVPAGAGQLQGDHAAVPGVRAAGHVPGGDQPVSQPGDSGPVEPKRVGGAPGRDRPSGVGEDGEQPELRQRHHDARGVEAARCHAHEQPGGRGEHACGFLGQA
jgi:uncharacterized protein YeaO (DUF488 family)